MMHKLLSSFVSSPAKNAEEEHEDGQSARVPLRNSSGESSRSQLSSAPLGTPPRSGSNGQIQSHRVGHSRVNLANPSKNAQPPNQVGGAASCGGDAANYAGLGHGGDMSAHYGYGDPPQMPPADWGAPPPSGWSNPVPVPPSPPSPAAPSSDSMSSSNDADERRATTAKPSPPS